jgi:hypothetical protein
MKNVPHWRRGERELALAPEHALAGTHEDGKDRSAEERSDETLDGLLGAQLEQRRLSKRFACKISGETERHNSDSHDP